VSSLKFQLPDLRLSNDPGRPVLSALSSAFLENLNALFAIALEAAALAERCQDLQDRNRAEPEMVRLIEAALQRANRVHELAHWVYPAREPLALKDALDKAQALIQEGAPDDWVEDTFKDLQKRRVGRPNKRQSFIKAFEFQVQSTTNSQGKATRNFCPCGGKLHTAKCEQNLKAGMRSLKKVLRKYAPELVSRYEELHPDRARKVNG
jgi:hypothetical protein